MATLKLVLRTNKRKKDGTCPIALRMITKDRKTRFVFIGQYVKEKDWDTELCRIRKSHPNSGRLNNFLSKKLGEANDFLLEADSGTNYVSSLEIKNKVKRKGKKRNQTITFSRDWKKQIPRIGEMCTEKGEMPIDGIIKS